MSIYCSQTHNLKVDLLKTCVSTFPTKCMYTEGVNVMVLWFSSYHYSITSFNKARTQVCAVSNPTRRVSEICSGENLWQLPRVAIKLDPFVDQPFRESISSSSNLGPIAVLDISCKTKRNWYKLFFRTSFATLSISFLSTLLSSSSTIYLIIRCGRLRGTWWDK